MSRQFYRIRPREARLAFVAALIACSLNMAVAFVWDPFGFQTERADGSARRATALVLCDRINTYDRLQDSGVSPNIIEILQDSIDDQRRVEGLLGIDCPIINNSTREDRP